MKTQKPKTNDASKPMLEPMLEAIAADVSELTVDDIALLSERELLKAQLKALDEHLKPRIARTIDNRGTGKFALGERTIELKRSTRDSVSWASLATALIDEITINKHKPNYTVTSNIDSVKVVS